MLYKKYHRNFVKQFRRGAILMFDIGEGDKIISKPFIDSDYGEICIRCTYEWTLVFFDGKINHEMKIKENVI